MNKLLLNDRARNHIRFMPAKQDLNLGIPEDEADKIRWCESRYHDLQHRDDIKRLYISKNKSKGYLISVWEMDGLYYLIECIRNEFKTFNVTIYIDTERDQMLSIAQFIPSHIDQIMADYKKQILDARDYLIREAAKPDGNA